MSTVAERLTADEYLAREDARRTELIDGVLVVNEPTVLHQHVVGLIHAALLASTRAAANRRGGGGRAAAPPGRFRGGAPSHTLRQAQPASRRPQNAASGPNAVCGGCALPPRPPPGGRRRLTPGVSAAGATPPTER